MGRASRRSKAAKSCWEKRRHIPVAIQKIPLRKGRLPFPSLPSATKSPTTLHTARSTIVHRNNYLSNAISLVHGEGGEHHGVYRLLKSHYHQLYSQIVESHVDKAIITRLKQTCSTTKFKWKIASLRLRTKLTTREYGIWRQELTPMVLGISNSTKSLLPSIDQINDLIDQEVQFPVLQQIGSSVGRCWALPDMVREWTQLHCVTLQRKDLIWFNNRENEFIWSIALDGSPETKDIGKVVVCCAPWNLGPKIHCRDNWVVVFGFDGDEQGEVMEEYCNKLRNWITAIESAPLIVGDIATTHKFIPLSDQKMLAYLGGQFGQSFKRFSIWCGVSQLNKVNTQGKLGVTWPLFTHTQRIADGKLVEAERAKIEAQFQHLTETTRSKKICDYVTSTLTSAQKRVPFLDISRSLPDGTHNDCNGTQQWLGHLINFSLSVSTPKYPHGTLAALVTILNNLHLTHVAKKIQKKYLDNVEKNKKKLLHDVKWRLIGRDAITLMQQFRLVAKCVLPSDPQATHIVWLQILFVAGRLLRDISYHYSSRNTSDAMLSALETLCQQYYTLYCLFFPHSGITPTVFTIGKVVPWAARKTWNEYGVGLGFNLMQAPESVNALTNTMLEDTNWTIDMNRKDKWTQVMHRLYLLQFVLPQKDPTVESHLPKYKTRIKVTSDGCWCGETITEPNEQRCRFCKTLSPLESILLTSNRVGSYANLVVL